MQQAADGHLELHPGQRRADAVVRAASTSFRISDTAKRRLTARAAREGVSATRLLDRLIIEGIDQIDYPGITFRPSVVRTSASAVNASAGSMLTWC